MLSNHASMLRSLRSPKVLLLTVPLLAGAALVSGCGNDVPPNAVAKVGDSVIEKSEFDKFLKLAAAGQGQQTGGPAVVPDPPNFTNCVAERQKQKTPKGTPKQTPVQLRAQCRQEYNALKDQVMQFLIQSEWIQQEAENRDVKVSDAEVKKQFADQKKQSFPKEKDYQKFLKDSGMSEQDILFQVRLEVLQQELQKKIVEGEGKATDEEIQEYYDKNKKRFSQPERRNVGVVLTKTKARAERAKRALARGQSFRRVSKRYSTDQASKSQGGRLPDVAKGQQEKALDAAVFAAPKGKLSGPIKTQFGWYVFEVSSIKPATQQSVEQAEESIRNVLKSENEQKALDDFIKDFREKYKEETKCAKGFVVQECENAPKQDTSTAPGGQPGVPQQGAPQQGAPPQQGTPAPAPQGAPPPSGGAPAPAPAPAPPPGG